ncbi:DUF3040 domain-containing protein [Nigerium sp.]|jgi:transcriptional regulator of aromatic amino acid metabolism|uniref:DUF3040 domain-containing protein n=1 Tax=Nigerium sp. TaxID=2042655 RepID=UPI003221C156
MALSEEEQRLLEQMEAALAADDPKFANTLRGTSTRRLHKRRVALAGLGFVVGIAGLIAGMETHPAVSVIGFVVMLVSTIAALTSWQHVGNGNDGVPARPSQPRPKSPTTDTPFMDKMEERWRRRQDDGL